MINSLFSRPYWEIFSLSLYLSLGLCQLMCIFNSKQQETSTDRTDLDLDHSIDFDHKLTTNS